MAPFIELDPADWPGSQNTDTWLPGQSEPGPGTANPGTRRPGLGLGSSRPQAQLTAWTGLRASQTRRTWLLAIALGLGSGNALLQTLKITHIGTF